jgi:hypothetical protein
LKSPCAEGPFVQRYATYAQWIVAILIGACAVAIEGDRKAVDTKFGHIPRR